MGGTRKNPTGGITKDNIFLGNPGKPACRFKDCIKFFSFTGRIIIDLENTPAGITKHSDHCFIEK